jgi:anti-sigma regulatory factor (Ser/Thr protein kinase)
MPTPATVPTVTHFERSYPGTTDQVRLVRADLRAVLEDCPIGHDVILFASELVTNATVHSRSGHPGGRYTVRAEIHHGDYAWVEVEDGGGDWANANAGTGLSHGLDIVNTLAADWGIDGDEDGRIVWARLDMPTET